MRHRLRTSKKAFELDAFVLRFRLRRWEDRRKKGVIRILARKRLVLRTIIDRQAEVVRADRGRAYLQLALPLSNEPQLTKTGCCTRPKRVEPDSRTCAEPDSRFEPDMRRSRQRTRLQGRAWSRQSTGRSSTLRWCSSCTERRSSPDTCSCSHPRHLSLRTAKAPRIALIERQLFFSFFPSTHKSGFIVFLRIKPVQFAV